MTPKQVRHIISSALRPHGQWSKDWEYLLLFTCGVESLMGKYRTQIGGGPALGIYQEEPATFNDTFDNYLKYHDYDIRRKPAEVLEWNDIYATRMCYFQYKRFSEPLPKAGKVREIAEYWKKHWNTSKGAGDVDQAVRKFHKLMDGHIAGIQVQRLPDKAGKVASYIHPISFQTVPKGKTAYQIASQQVTHSKSIFRRIGSFFKHTFSASNIRKAINIVKFVDNFLPYSKLIDKGLSIIQTFIPKSKIMAKSKFKKSRIWGIVAGVVGIILTAFGISADTSFLANGLQTADIAAIIGIIQLAVAHWLHKQADEQHQNKMEQK